MCIRFHICDCSFKVLTVWLWFYVNIDANLTSNTWEGVLESFNRNMTGVVEWLKKKGLQQRTYAWQRRCVSARMTRNPLGIKVCSKHLLRKWLSWKVWQRRCWMAGQWERWLRLICTGCLIRDDRREYPDWSSPCLFRVLQTRAGVAVGINQSALTCWAVDNSERFPLGLVDYACTLW